MIQSVERAAAILGALGSGTPRLGVTEIAERFTQQWEQASGIGYHPWADIITVIGDLDSLHDHPPRERLAIEDALAAAVAQLSGDSR